MASIITATTTSGLTQFADNSGVLQLASGVGNLVTVPAVTGTVMVSGNMPAFSASSSSGTSIPNVTFTKVLVQTENFDTNNCFASSAFTPNVAGYYQINAMVGLGVANYPCLVTIYKNGSAYMYGSVGSFQASAINTQSAASSLIYCNGTTDYIEMYVIQASGSTQTTQTSVATQFSGYLARAV